MTLSEAQSIFRQNSWTTCSASFDNSYSCSAIASFNSSWDPEPEPEPWRSVPSYTGYCGSIGVTAYTTEATNNPVEEAWRAVPVFGPSPEDNDQYETEQEEKLAQYAGSNDYYNPAPQVEVEHSYIDDYMNKETEISKLVQQYNELIE